MRGLSYRPGKSWPRNPHASSNQSSEPSVIRQRTRSHDRPIPPGGMGL